MEGHRTSWQCHRYRGDEYLHSKPKHCSSSSDERKILQRYSASTKELLLPLRFSHVLRCLYFAASRVPDGPLLDPINLYRHFSCGTTPSFTFRSSCALIATIKPRHPVLQVSLTRGDGRYVHPQAEHFTLDSNAADAEYRGILVTDMTPGALVLWEFEGSWEMDNRFSKITLRELKAVRLTLFEHFSHFVCNANVQRLLVHSDTQAAIHVQNAMFSASPTLMG